MMRRVTDVIVIGDGVIGLSTAHALAEAGIACTVVGANRPGAASGAAAGLLAPSLRLLGPPARAFFADSLARYPAFIRSLQSVDSSLRLLSGLIELGAPGQDPGDDATVPAGGSRLSPASLSVLEPAVRSSSGGVLHSSAGAIDNVRLVAALGRAVRSHPRAIVVADDPVVRLNATIDAVSVRLASGREVTADAAVLAAGAWSNRIAGLPRPLPIFPLKGQMLAVESSVLRHAVMGPGVYLVPREREIAVGATIEDVGFDVTVDARQIEQLRRKAIELCPALAEAPVVRRWAGLRAATPDLLPIIGPDPDAPRLLYACGHSRNGILLAPSTAAAIVALVDDRALPWNLEPFSVARFHDDGARRGRDLLSH